MNRWIAKKYAEKKHRAYIIKHVEHICDDCGKTGLVVMRISNLNLIAWFLLGVIVFVCAKTFLTQTTLQSIWLGIIAWFGATWINIKKVKPQCRHCFSERVRIPEKNEQGE